MRLSPVACASLVLAVAACSGGGEGGDGDGDVIAEVEPNESPEEATALPAPGTAAFEGECETAGPLDYFRAEGVTGVDLEIRIDPADAIVDVFHLFVDGNLTIEALGGTGGDLFFRGSIDPAGTLAFGLACTNTTGAIGFAYTGTLVTEGG